MSCTTDLKGGLAVFRYGFQARYFAIESETAMFVDPVSHGLQLQSLWIIPTAAVS